MFKKAGRKRAQSFTGKEFDKPSSEVNFVVLEKKWRDFFKFLDVDNDKAVTEADFARIAEKMILAHQVRGSKAKDIRQALKGWWNVFKMHVGSARNIATEEEYFRAVKTLFMQQRTIFLAHTKELADSMFDSIDVDGNGVITRGEYIKMFRVFGVDNTSYIGRVFDRLDLDKSGVIDRGEFKNAIVEFNMLDDETNNMGFMFRIPKEA